MCGGRGTRLGGETEKPLVPIDGTPMFDRAAAALRESRVDTVYAVVSPNAPETAAHARERGVPTVETPGEGYVEDLECALGEVGRPVVTVAADLPLLAADHVDDAIAAARRDEAGCEDDAFDSVTVCVPAALKRRLGASADSTFECEGRELAPTGLNVVSDAPDDTVRITYDARLAVNVNRPDDAELAEDLCD
ncbi:cobalamin biosynthesis protein CobY [Halopelagius longus]|uniref:Adenosylcobinamide-phosphate guanylyltransferase n=2 Tax=Halopelagius longus TaxID=1236180 RepID=A0A1H1DIP7_9EURY|nr:NTP transferase domain-containing protein [Halopelagius longus]RDI71351.1 cobalamin biosynthesis protein CobY [Halopelagius longus]SDQ76375.1 adenosylcobinamide-phosphate guanylyltransferase [Halopelagius longus]